MNNLSLEQKNTIKVIATFHIKTGVYPTVDQLAKITGLSDISIIRTIEMLINCGYFKEEKALNKENYRYH
jgi:hypothetical protein